MRYPGDPATLGDIPNVADFARQILDMQRRIEDLEHENSRLREHESKYADADRISQLPNGPASNPRLNDPLLEMFAAINELHYTSTHLPNCRDPLHLRLHREATDKTLARCRDAARALAANGELPR